MTSFDDREKAYEKKFAHDAELKFKASARRNKLLGVWAAEKMGMTGDDVEHYAKGVVLADLEEPGDEDVFRKVRSDFDDAGITGKWRASSEAGGGLSLYMHIPFCRPGSELLQCARAYLPSGCVDDAQKCSIIIRVGQQTQIGHQVLDFSA